MNKYTERELKHVIKNVFNLHPKDWKSAMFALGENIICGFLDLSDEELADLGWRGDK